MGRLIKLAIIIVAIMIFLFSENPIITNVRNIAFTTAKKVYTIGSEVVTDPYTKLAAK